MSSIVSNLQWRHVNAIQIHGGGLLGELGHQPDQPLDAVKGRGGAAGLQHEPPPGDEERTLGQHVGGDLRVGHGGNDLALGQPEHLFQINPVKIFLLLLFAVVYLVLPIFRYLSSVYLGMLLKSLVLSTLLFVVNQISSNFSAPSKKMSSFLS